ncbi:MAG: hypothetical protein SPK79_11020, partial [Erysipelotrichaceae bacterium]|nr:hypothetical protein [Erysipelotrichaceae bacterium]
FYPDSCTAENNRQQRKHQHIEYHYYPFCLYDPWPVAVIEMNTGYIHSEESIMNRRNIIMVITGTSFEMLFTKNVK